MIKGKQMLCYTEISDFTDYQGIGHDPLYKRYDSVFSVVQRAVPSGIQHFLAESVYNDAENRIYWYINKWEETPRRLTELTGATHDKYKSILTDIVEQYKTSLNSLNGDDLQIMAGVIKYIDDERVYCCDDKVFLVAWGMTLDTHQHKVVGHIIHDCKYIKKYKITFDAGEHGSLPGYEKSKNRVEGVVLSKNDFPNVTAEEGWIFTGWEPSPVGMVVESDLKFTAQYEKENKIGPMPTPPVVNPENQKEPITEPGPVDEPDPLYYSCKFDAGEHGRTEGSSIVKKKANSILESYDIPHVLPDNGYKFCGWDITPDNMVVNCDKTFTARYEKEETWFHRWYGIFIGKGCLKWLLWFIIGLLLCLLLSWLLRSCTSCNGRNTPTNGVIPADTIAQPGGKSIDDNGSVRPIGDDKGRLPKSDRIVAPVMEKSGGEPPIIRQPGVPSIIANRLFLFMENDNDNVEALAQDFKKVYPDNKYSIIGYDKEVKLLVIQIPEDERDRIRETINSKIPNHKFIVFDEEIYELNGKASSQPINPGWHIRAIHLRAGWKVTQGSPDVRIAVVDDGIESTHPMFKGRIVDAYNVFTQDNKLSLGEGHGTHTAGIAAGSAEFVEQGAAGVAPGCMLIPVQVFDNEQCPLSALIAGVMYAIHHDADVVNISVGPSFKGINALPIKEQKDIAQSRFKNVERLWSRVCLLAAKKNCILVFAAGNDDILSSIPPENRNSSSITVTAVDEKLCQTDFTNYGPGSDISAPGKDILSSFPRGDFKAYDGTSMAAPIVTGTIALMKTLKKDLTVVQARNVLYRTGADVYGKVPPMVLVDKALQGVKEGDFSEPKRREESPLPDGTGDDSSARQIGDTDDDNTVSTPTQPTDGTDYDAIRKLIEQHQKEIDRLKKLLPNSKPNQH